MAALFRRPQRVHYGADSRLRLRGDFSAIETIRIRSSGRCAIPKDKLGPIRSGGKPNKEREMAKREEGERGKLYSSVVLFHQADIFLTC